MITLEEALFALVTTHAVMTPVISTRFYPQVMPPKATLPLCVYKKISGPRDMSHDGNDGLHQARVQIAFWGEDYKALKDSVVKPFVKNFHGYKGAADAVIQQIRIVNEIDGYNAGDTKRHNIVVDAMIWHREETN